MFASIKYFSFSLSLSLAGVEGNESPLALGKSAVGRDAVDWARMGASKISLAETVTRYTSRRSSSCIFDHASSQ